VVNPINTRIGGMLGALTVVLAASACMSGSLGAELARAQAPAGADDTAVGGLDTTGLGTVVDTTGSTVIDPGTAPPATTPPADPQAGQDDTAVGALDQTGLGTPVDETTQPATTPPATTPPATTPPATTPPATTPPATATAPSAPANPPAAPQPVIIINVPAAPSAPAPAAAPPATAPSISPSSSRPKNTKKHRKSAKRKASKKRHGRGNHHRGAKHGRRGGHRTMALMAFSSEGGPAAVGYGWDVARAATSSVSSEPKSASTTSSGGHSGPIATVQSSYPGARPRKNMNARITRTTPAWVHALRTPAPRVGAGGILAG
jgi:hypothetical protein